MKAAHQNELEAVFMKHYKEWCLLSFGFLKNMAEAEDVVQDICVKLLLKEQGDDVLNLGNYVKTAVRNASLTRIKRLKKLRKIEWANTLVPSYETELITAETTADINRKLDALPEKSKKVFELCVLDGLKYENAAETMGISVNTVKYHLKKSFKVLRFNLRNTYFCIAITTYLLFF